MRTIINVILNIIWVLTAGLWLWLGYILAGVLACIFIVTIPFGVASFRIFPFGREAVQVRPLGAVGTLGNVVWFLIAGLWLAAGHVVTALAQAVTIIGLPLAWANLKLIPITCFPFGKEIISTGDSRVI